jgi:general secretion pathway protein D
VAFTSSIAWSQAVSNAKPPAPIQLKPISNAPITLHMVDESKTIYQAIGKVAGLTVLFRPGLRQSRHSVQLDLTDASLSPIRSALSASSPAPSIMPLTSNTIYVAADTRAKTRRP